jgi:DNA-binding NarL/FixJ family response regulator
MVDETSANQEIIRVFLADDHALFRDGVSALLNQDPYLQVVGTCGDGLDVLDNIEALQPDVVILDISLPGMNGLDLCREITRIHDDISVLIVTMHAQEQCVVDALENGAAGYLLKAVPGNEFAKAIHAVAKGEVYLGAGISSSVLRRINQPNSDPYKTLTTRERQVLQLAAEGNTNKKIADQLEISVKTVDTHRCRLMQKLDLHCQADLVRFAISRKIISLQ